MDFLHRFAVVAFDPMTERGVAIARFEPLEEGAAELAVVLDRETPEEHTASS